MLSRRQLPLTWITLLIILCVLNTVFASRRRHDHDDDDDDDYDDDDDDDWDYDNRDKGDKDNKDKVEQPEFTTPRNDEWLREVDFSKITGKIRPVGSGICEDAKCDGTDNEKCFESCGNMATDDDIYGCPKKNTWSLSFDDGPSNYTVDLLDILDEADVKVTFCVMGSHAKQYPEIIKRAYKAGHQIASHTYSHPHLMSLTNEEIVYEVLATEEAIKDAIGVKPRYIRPPYGEADGRVKAILKQLGYTTLMWNVDPTDYNVHMLEDGGKRIQKAFVDIANGKPSNLNAHNDAGFISLQHDLYGKSINQVPKIIDFLQSKGYSLKTSAECIGDDEPHGKTRREIKDKKKDQDPNDRHHDDDYDDDEYSEDKFKKAGIDNIRQAVHKNAQQHHQRQLQQQQESSAASLTYSAISAALAIIGLASYFS